MGKEIGLSVMEYFMIGIIGVNAKRCKIMPEKEVSSDG